MSIPTGASPPATARAPLDVPQLYARLRETMGPRQHWWPVRSRTEILLGSVLVQNANWRNAEASLACLREAGLTDLDSILALPQSRLIELIRPSGFQIAKSRAIAGLAHWAIAHREAQEEAQREVREAWDPTTGRARWLGPELVASRPTHTLRTELLALPGVGPETADVLLLYVFGRPVFIADGYARRLFTRLGVAVPRSYDGFARLVTAGTEFPVGRWQEFHGLIDDFGKLYCRNDEAWSAGPLAGDSMSMGRPPS